MYFMVLDSKRYPNFVVEENYTDYEKTGQGNAYPS